MKNSNEVLPVCMLMGILCFIMGFFFGTTNQDKDLERVVDNECLYFEAQVRDRFETVSYIVEDMIGEPEMEGIEGNRLYMAGKRAAYKNVLGDISTPTNE